MNTLLKRTLKGLVIVPLVVVPVLTLAAEHSNRDRGGDRHDQGHQSQQHSNRGNDHGRGNDRRDHSNVRVNIGIGSRPYYGPSYGSSFGYNSIFDNWSYGVGYSSFGGQYYLNSGYPYSALGYRSRPVVIERNTYIERPTTRVYTNRTNETSLLRDVNGRCFERTYDRNGNETRVELDPAECDF